MSCLLIKGTGWGGRLPPQLKKRLEDKQRMDKVYIISRYRAFTRIGMEFNRKVARYFCRKVVSEGKIPVAPHLFYPQFLDDGNEKERQIGLDIGLKELHEADEFLLIVIDGRISEGMQMELRQAARDRMHGKAVYMTHKEMKELIGCTPSSLI